MTPIINTVSNSSPFEAWSVISFTRSGAPHRPFVYRTRTSFPGNPLPAVHPPHTRQKQGAALPSGRSTRKAPPDVCTDTEYYARPDTRGYPDEARPGNQQSPPDGPESSLCISLCVYHQVPNIICFFFPHDSALLSYVFSFSFCLFFVYLNYFISLTEDAPSELPCY